MKTAILFCLLCISCQLAFAQERPQQPPYRQGEVLVQLKSGQQPTALTQQTISYNGHSTQLQLKKKVVESMNIWLFQFDPSQISHEAILYTLRHHPSVAIAQNNHIISHRNTTPNDTDFSQQWQYINNGGSGGVVDADIDADLAWDITTGGVTPLGDTIVICVVDDGLDITHQDFGDNIWVNHAEIPNNNTDDDGNGFVDDWRGWNMYANDNDISDGGNGGFHGSCVAGIVGAKGNNGLGVAGVNWNVKLMIVVGGGNEADALQAYAYPLMMRRLYNQTNGAQGAYVVGTNASWGVDLLPAAQAPLWCAMYDTLGTEGILSAGATTNSNVNVDVQGDMPTSCGSPYLITVTNLQRNNTKVGAAGYGATTIDLGAYGEDAYTVAANNSYAPFGGTSGATPHVAGAIGLIHATPCIRLAAMYKADPATTALQIKNFILNGVDAVSGLNGITTTGGHLNLFNTLQLAMASGCAMTGCYEPYNIHATNISGTSMQVNWATVGDATGGYIVHYREVGTPTWSADSTVADTFLLLTNLQACTSYEFEIKADCDTTQSRFTAAISFKTGDCCYPPNTINLDTTLATTAQFNWILDNFVDTYYFYYRPVGSTIWDTATTSTNVLNLINLDSCTEYEYYMESRCAVNVNNAPSHIFRFKTKGCGICEDVTYCPMAGNDASYEWIERISMNVNNTLGQTNFSNTSGTNGGYGNFVGTSNTLTVQPGDVVNFSFLMGQDNSGPDWRWKIWVDYNEDGILADTAERVFDSGYLQVDSVSGSFTIPHTAGNGIARMRIAMKYGTLLATPCTSYNYGEVEDYCLHITNATGVAQVLGRSNHNELLLYPNPVNELLNVQFTSTQAGKATIELYNIAGQLCTQQRIATQIGQNQYLVPTHSLVAGSYIVVLRMEDGTIWRGQILK